MRLLLLIAVFASVSPSLESQVFRSQVETGVVHENIKSDFDPTQSFALYVPTSYRRDRSWPVLFLLDPRGRARVPLDLFREAAEKRGYVLISSYNTASDTRVDVNTPALRAMLHDANRLFSLDQRRFYLSGFSGTARVAWLTAADLENNVAGIIGFGGGLPFDYRPPKKTRYAFYGAAGNTDFNYEEMLELDETLDKREIVHRVDFFTGGHEWGPMEVCTRALEWMELQAMKTDLREKDDALIADMRERRLTEADGAKSPLESFLRYRAMVEDFEKLLGPDELNELTAKARELEEREEVRDALKKRRKLSGQYRNNMKRFGRFLQGLDSGEVTLALPEMIRELRLYPIMNQAKDEPGSMEADAAQRFLESVYVQTSYYLPREYLDKHDPNRALALLRLAEVIKPDSVQAEFFSARAYAQKGDAKKAVESLERVNAVHALDPKMLDSDPYLDPIRDEEEFRAFMIRLRES